MLVQSLVVWWLWLGSGRGGRFWRVLGIVGWLLLVATGSLVSATETVVLSERFESHWESRWQVVPSTGISWQVVNGVLVGKASKAGRVGVMVPTAQVWHSSWGNYRFSFDLYVVSGADKNVVWNYQDPLNWYEAHLVGNLVELYRLRQGQMGYQSTHGYFLTPLTWHRVQVEVMQQTMRLWVDGWLVAEVQDWYLDGRVGPPALKVGAGSVVPTEVWFDNLEVILMTGVQDTQVEVPKFSQADLAWSQQLYDTAREWAPTDPTLQRWGCAVTSLAMGLRSYGFTTLLDGTDLNPGSLNQWLQSQSDGYIAAGWVNWRAAERLTRLLAAQADRETSLRVEFFGSPQTPDGELRSRLVAELQNQHPTIISLPGHFVVGYATVADRQDVLIHDPNETFTTLNSAALAGNELQSLRLLTPQLLSDNAGRFGWLIAGLGVGRVQVWQGTTEITELLQLWQGPERGAESVVNASDTADSWQVWWLPDLADGEYRLEFLDNQPGALVQWWAYEPQELVSQRLLQDIPESFSLPVRVQSAQTFWEEASLESWQAVWEWWESLALFYTQENLEGWLRIRWLLQKVNTTQVVTKRHFTLLFDAVTYYQQHQPDPHLSQLHRKLTTLQTWY